MAENVLREFLHRSREWSRAAHGIDLFRFAAEDLQRFADVDAGFFVYRKRLQTDKNTSDKARVYLPWGVFSQDVPAIEDLVDRMIAKREVLNRFMERWSSFEELSVRVQQLWSDYDLTEFGIWPIISRELQIGAIVVARTRASSNRLTMDTRLTLLDVCAAQIALAVDLIWTRRVAEEASQRDLLTGLFNRRGLNSAWPKIIHQARSAGKSVIIGLVDVNNLKRVNDTKGHPAGDQLLREVADILQASVRSDDLVARIGGDEFAVILKTNHSDSEGAMNALQTSLTSVGHSVSVGGAMWGPDGESWDACYHAADARLYACKRKSKSKSRHDSGLS